jgi:hypothetical protein
MHFPPSYPLDVVIIIIVTITAVRSSIWAFQGERFWFFAVVAGCSIVNTLHISTVGPSKAGHTVLINFFAIAEAALMIIVVVYVALTYNKHLMDRKV